MGIWKIQPAKKTRKFNGKVYHWHKYESMKTMAGGEARRLRDRGFSTRVVAQPGYGQGGWNIYVRRRAGARSSKGRG